jgi:hypothetical protein
MNVYLIGNSLSVLYGAVGWFIIDGWLGNKFLLAVGAPAVTLLLTVTLFVWTVVAHRADAEALTKKAPEPDVTDMG